MYNNKNSNWNGYNGNYGMGAAHQTPPHFQQFNGNMGGRGGGGQQYNGAAYGNGYGQGQYGGASNGYNPHQHQMQHQQQQQQQQQQPMRNTPYRTRWWDAVKTQIAYVESPEDSDEECAMSRNRALSQYAGVTPQTVGAAPQNAINYNNSSAPATSSVPGQYSAAVDRNRHVLNSNTNGGPPPTTPGMPRHKNEMNAIPLHAAVQDYSTTHRRTVENPQEDDVHIEGDGDVSGEDGDVEDSDDDANDYDNDADDSRVGVSAFDVSRIPLSVLQPPRESGRPSIFNPRPSVVPMSGEPEISVADYSIFQRPTHPFQSGDYSEDGDDRPQPSAFARPSILPRINDLDIGSPAPRLSVPEISLVPEATVDGIKHTEDQSPTQIRQETFSGFNSTATSPRISSTNPDTHRISGDDAQPVDGLGAMSKIGGYRINTNAAFADGQRTSLSTRGYPPTAGQTADDADKPSAEKDGKEQNTIHRIDSNGYSYALRFADDDIDYGDYSSVVDGGRQYTMDQTYTQRTTPLPQGEKSNDAGTQPSTQTTRPEMANSVTRTGSEYFSMFPRRFSGMNTSFNIDFDVADLPPATRPRKSIPGAGHDPRMLSVVADKRRPSENAASAGGSPTRGESDSAAHHQSSTSPMAGYSFMPGMHGGDWDIDRSGTVTNLSTESPSPSSSQKRNSRLPPLQPGQQSDAGGGVHLPPLGNNTFPHPPETHPVSHQSQSDNASLSSAQKPISGPRKSAPNATAGPSNGTSSPRASDSDRTSTSKPPPLYPSIRRSATGDTSRLSSRQGERIGSATSSSMGSASSSLRQTDSKVVIPPRRKSERFVSPPPPSSSIEQRLRDAREDVKNTFRAMTDNKVGDTFKAFFEKVQDEKAGIVSRFPNINRNPAPNPSSPPAYTPKMFTNQRAQTPQQPKENANGARKDAGASSSQKPSSPSAKAAPKVLQTPPKGMQTPPLPFK